jgi:hypothetical protein
LIVDPELLTFVVMIPGDMTLDGLDHARDTLNLNERWEFDVVIDIPNRQLTLTTKDFPTSLDEFETGRTYELLLRALDETLASLNLPCAITLKTLKVEF